MATKTKLAESNGRLSQMGIADKSAQKIELRPIEIQIFNLKLVGTSPLIVHKFSEKNKKQIEDKQQKKATIAKETRDPHAEYLACFYMIPGSSHAGSPDARYGFPASGFKNAAVDACSFIDGITKVLARGAFHVVSPGGLVEIKYADVSMREDTVRIGMGALDLRYRPEFTGWSCELAIHYNASVLSPEQIVNLFNVAGFSVGIGEWRPQKDGSNGMFQVATA